MVILLAALRSSSPQDLSFSLSNPHTICIRTCNFAKIHSTSLSFYFFTCQQILNTLIVLIQWNEIWGL